MPAAPARPLLPAAARLLPPGSDALARSWEQRGRTAWPVHRRGVDFGFALPVHRTVHDRATALRLWRAGEPVFVPGALGDGPVLWRAAIADSLAMFDRLRAGGDFLDELEARLRGATAFEYTGSSEENDDPRDRERVWVDHTDLDGAIARDLWAALAWIADDQSDASMRIRFSSGDGSPDGWQHASEAVSCAVDAFARSSFPECAAIDACEPLQDLLQHLIPRPFRLSERIVYNNAPGGGAMFHHDAEPGQLGVCFSQLQGHTAWLALGKRRLARLLAANEGDRSRSADARWLRRLDDTDDRWLWRRLNRDAAFAQRLAAAGALFVLEAGDTILLPSNGFDDVAWHSVFALGATASLAHSYGVFPRAVAAEQPDRRAPARRAVARRRRSR
ncbi:MAG: hypothetical protein AB7O97_00850 [Planctomycetota bacterium]